MFAGTIFEDIDAILRQSDIPYEYIPLRMLKQLEYLEIAQYMIGDNSRLSNVRNALMYMGMIQVFFQVIDTMKSLETKSIGLS